MGEAQTAIQFTHLTSRLDYLSAHMNNWGWALAVEEALGIEVPVRAQHIRVIMAELTRISSHQLWWGVLGMDLGAFTPFLYGFRDRGGSSTSSRRPRRAPDDELHSPRAADVEGLREGRARLPPCSTLHRKYETARRQRDLPGAHARMGVLTRSWPESRLHRAGAARQRRRTTCAGPTASTASRLRPVAAAATAERYRVRIEDAQSLASSARRSAMPEAGAHQRPS
jgi:hypothetical protein